jgi:hypothetical protein
VLLLLQPVLHLLVGMCMMLVVLNPPGLKGIDQGHECQSSHNVPQQLVLAEAAVATIMANDEELQNKATHNNQCESSLRVKAWQQTLVNVEPTTACRSLPVQNKRSHNKCMLV